MPGLVAERLGNRLADDDAGIFGGVVEIDVQIALGLERDVDQRVAGQLLQHVIEKADAGRDVVGARAVEIDGRGDLGLLGLARDRGLPLHGISPPARRIANRLISLAGGQPSARAFISFDAPGPRPDLPHHGRTDPASACILPPKA